VLMPALLAQDVRVLPPPLLPLPLLPLSLL
jgi:hypothetical protein